MANFITAFNVTMKAEGTYNPGVGEAETYKGIDRAQNPDWSGWADIDAIKGANPGASTSTLDELFTKDKELQTNVQQFYETNYWNPMQLGTINNQQVANAIFDCNVNPCIITAARAAQMACNTVMQKSVTVDGQVGPLTLHCINSISPQLYVTALNGIRVANYYQRVSLTPADSEWLGSWLGRCIPYGAAGA